MYICMFICLRPPAGFGGQLGHGVGGRNTRRCGQTCQTRQTCRWRRCTSRASGPNSTSPSRPTTIMTTNQDPACRRAVGVMQGSSPCLPRDGSEGSENGTDAKHASAGAWRCVTLYPMAQVYVSSEWPELYESFASDDFGPVKPPNLHSNPCIYVYVCAYIHISIYLSDDFGPVTLSPPTPDPHTLNLNLNPNLSTPNPEP